MQDEINSSHDKFQELNQNQLNEVKTEIVDSEEENHSVKSGDADKSTSGKSDFEQVRRKSIKDEFTIAKDLLKMKINEDDVEKEIEETVKNTESFEILKLSKLIEYKEDRITRRFFYLNIGSTESIPFFSNYEVTNVQIINTNFNNFSNLFS